MTTQSDDNQRQSAEAKSAQDRVPPTQDWVLEDFVRLAGRVDGFGIGVTLVVAGAVITGTLIGFREYFREYGKQWAKALGGGENARFAEERWSKVGEDDLAALEHAATPRFSYVHLKNARFVTGTMLVPTKGGMLWRGRLSEVSGFSFGGLTNTEDPQRAE
jgi:hypothetical protein